MKRPGTPTRTPFRPSAIARGSGPRPTPMPKVNRARKAANLLRAYGPPERRAWVKRQPCIVRSSRLCDGPIQNVHTVTGGTSRKADAHTIVPCCRWHHNQLHHIGAESFQRGYGVDLAALAEATERAWLAAQAAA